ncbi:hypothetical protein A3A09_02485 [Candidatus Nomurabacteria bacterium RIFCSPLOWO2_01_FULL_42_20]|uniref:Uncharacterized protein n=1 Tax=Candidatus Nomurabacteria bacterium RIFCSPHIGHO2_01_FULL_42_16 TaxID=1801743 RepID=A0A1F6VK29_9BACT|nr:MAG: hypothetical protein A2824_00030 [Candidatus Nomurabacteria bacterium RIFCSPHIGHO2_01_FULL_42_16]OGI92509.1 MAG: hypothetical protein A3A09_02485 [Candidatus Nomurabacteria bacterium RIFCSPLOWO2_01_FULL_42_20]
MLKKIIGFTGVGAGALLPLLAAAQQTLGGVGVTILNIINTIVLIIIALAFLFFLVGVVKYITAKEEKAKGEARNNMIYGIIGLFVMFAVWGLVKLLQNTFGLEKTLCPGSPGICTNPVTLIQSQQVCDPITQVWTCPGF